MSRLKLFLLILIVAVLGIVFVQNQEPLVLKLLCPDRTQSCLYRTPQLPLAVWIAVFTIGGVVTSLLLQLLDRYQYSGAAKGKYVDNDLKGDRDYGYEDRPKQYSRKRDREDTTVYTTSTGYEKPQEPQSVEKSGSTYSYKYKDKQEDNNNVRKTPIESDINLDKDDDDEDWI